MTAQFAGQIAAPADALVVVPSVGFGRQSQRVLPATLELFAGQRPGRRTLVAVLVNRPVHQPPDDTEALTLRWIAQQADGPVHFAVASVALPVRPRLGDVRQLVCDALAAAESALAPDALAVVADDDLVAAPPGWLESLSRPLAEYPPTDLALGPVLFDDPTGSAVLCAPYFLSDALRALLAASWLSRLTHGCPGSGKNCLLVRTAVHEYAESMVLSGNLAVRLSALASAGGFRPLNEITNLLRDIQGLGCQCWSGTAPACRTSIVSTWSFSPDDPEALFALDRSALRSSNRRAGHAYLAGQPSVAQWRTCRFRASHADPVRVLPPPSLPPSVIRQLGRTARESLIGTVEPLLALTLDAFPPDAAVADEALRGLGLGAGACTARLHADQARWRVQIHDETEMLARLEALQAMHAAP